MVNRLLAVLSMVLFSSALALAQAAPTPDWKLSPQGIGPIEIGMNFTEAENASGMKFTATGPSSELGEDPACYFTSIKGVDHLLFMISEGKIVRVNIESPSFKTSNGIKIGDNEEVLKNAYANRLVEEPHKYIEQGHYFTLTVESEDRAIQFETDGKVIVSMHAGTVNDVFLVEGCL